MASMEHVANLAADLVRRYGTRNPLELCGALGILVRFPNLGEKLNGYYFCQSRIRMIRLNIRLNESARLIYLAHELGHDQIPTHRQIAKSQPFKELEHLYRPVPLEYEANVFAAELLIDDDRLMEFLAEGISFYRVADALGVPPELLDFKFRLLKRKGLCIEPLYIAKGDFLKKGLAGEHSQTEPMVVVV